MTIDIALVLGVIAGAFFLFFSEILPVELVGLLALLILALTGVLDPDEACRGFGDPTLIMIASVLVLSASLIRNGAGDRIANRVQRLSGGSTRKMVTSLLTATCGVSAFINNTAATAMFLPVAESLALRFKARLSRLLMPVAYASLLGGIVTLTGTSTNVAVAGAIGRRGMEPFGVFELTPVGLPIALAGVLYLLVFSRLLERRKPKDEGGEPGGLSGRRLFLTELVVPQGSPAVTRMIADLALEHRFGLSPVGLIRGTKRLSEAVLRTPLREGDVVIVEGDARSINRGASAAGLERKKSTKLSPAGSTALVEATVSFNSPLIGSTLREIDLRGRYGIDVIAIWRHGDPVIEKVGDIRLRVGDDLLIQGPPDQIRKLAGEPLYLLLGGLELPRYDRRREWLSLALFAAALGLGTSGLLPIAFAFLCGAVLVVLTKCISMEEAFRALDLRLIVLLGSMIGVAQAIETSGTAKWISGHLVAFLGGPDASPLLVMAGVYWMTIILTQPMSNAAAALLVLPVALASAATLGADPRPFAVAVAMAASLGFMTPLEPSCLLVMSPGRYRFADFLIFGTPLTIFCFLLAMVLIPLVFPF